MVQIATDAKNIADAFHTLANTAPNEVVYSQALASENDYLSDIPRKWQETRFKEVQGYVNAISHFLLEQGLTAGGKVAIVSGTRPEWMWADLGILSCGGVSVSVYQSLLPDDIAYILYDSDSKFVVAENQEQVDKLLEIVSKSWDIPATEDRGATSSNISLQKIIAIEDVDSHELVVQLSTILENKDATIPEATTTLTRDDVASLVYTSGTTGPPKGVIQSHGNHLANVRQAYDSDLLVEENSLALFLPLAHAFAKLMGYLGFLTLAQLRFPAIVDRKSSKLIPASVTKDIREGSAHIDPLVPRLLEKMRDGIIAKAAAPGLSGKLISLTLWAARENYQASKADTSPGFLAQLAYGLTGGLRKKIRLKLFGPHFKFCVSGGAKLPIAVAEFFTGLGIDIIEGYGLTETCVAANVGRLKNNKIGSVGPVLSDDIQMKIAEDGEILFKGPNIALGYHNRPTATKQAWDEDGWYHTGDLGSVDEDGYLFIVGRKKEIIVTSGGKNIAPHDIEETIKLNPLVGQSVLIGDGRKYCVALVALNQEEALRWAKAKGISDTSALHENEQVREYIWSTVSEMNGGLASYETVKKIFIVPEEFSIDNGQMTPTFKVKRSIVEKAYAAEIDAMYH